MNEKPARAATGIAGLDNVLGEIMRLSGASASAAHHLSEMMERQVAHMVRLVDDLVEVSRITRGKIELRKGRVALGAVIEAAVETSRPLIGEIHRRGRTHRDQRRAARRRGGSERER